MDALVALIGDIKEARANGVPDAQLDQPRRLQRRAQFMLDFVEAENSAGFHAPQEAERILAESIDYARQGQLALRGVAVPGGTGTLILTSARQAVYRRLSAFRRLRPPPQSPKNRRIDTPLRQKDDTNQQLTAGHIICLRRG